MGMSGSDVAAQETPDSPPTNLQLFRRIAAELATRSFRSAVPSDSSTVELTVLPQDIDWVVEQDIAKALTGNGGWIVRSHGAVTAEFGVLDLHVSYDNIRREHIFGPKVVDRSVGVTLHARITDTLNGASSISEERSASVRDTVFVSDLDRLEASTIHATRGVLPPEGIFENLAEPLIVLGTVAVAVVLLFTVRS